MKKTRIMLAALAALTVHGVAQAHHSFAAFFDPNKVISIKGTVTAFRFTNPHGTIAFDVKGADGKVTHWRAETNAPVLMVRRGWSRDVIKPGDVITVEGWVSRDGKPYLRLKQAFDANGKPIGKSPFAQSDTGA